MKVITVIIVLLLLVIMGFGGWYFFLKKSPEGGACVNEQKCEQGLKCLNKICSSGKVGSSCAQKSDCQSQFCAKNLCTEGKKDNVCATYKDCQSGLLCVKSVCATPPDYSKYFTKIIVSKMKVGSPPGPNNVPEPTTQFKTTDAIEVDMEIKSSDVKGEFYYSVVDSKTGEIGFSQQKQQIDGQSRGTGSDLPVPPGEYDLNVYFNDELVYTVPITISK